MTVRLTLGFPGSVALFMRPLPLTNLQYRRTEPEHLGNLATQPASPTHFLDLFFRKNFGSKVGAWNEESESTTIPDRSGRPPAFDHPQGVAPGSQWLATQFIHEGPHQVNSPAPHAQLPRIHVRNRSQIERICLVQEQDFHNVSVDAAANLDRGLGIFPVAVANDIGN